MNGAAGNALAIGTRLIVGVTPRWAGCDPAPGPRIYYSNHGSHLDPLVIWSCLPPRYRVRTHPVAARDYWTKTELRRYLARRLFRAVLVDRSAVDTVGADGKALARLRLQMQRMVRVLGADRSLIIFPEGTRSEEGGLGPFQPGIYHLARRCPRAECVPVYLRNLNRILPKGEVLPVPLMGSATFGEPLHLQDCESREAFLDRARQGIVKLMPAEDQVAVSSGGGVRDGND